MSLPTKGPQTVGYKPFADHYCGGTSVTSWTDGSDSAYGKGPKDVKTCQAMCDKHSECHAFQVMGTGQ